MRTLPPSGGRVPRVPLKPPPGYSFASTPGTLNDLVHNDNFLPCANAQPGETFIFIDNYQLRGTGTVIGLMRADDPRANAKLLPKDTIGVWFKNEQTKVYAWKAQGWYRTTEGRLTLQV